MNNECRICGAPRVSMSDNECRYCKGAFDIVPIVATQHAVTSDHVCVCGYQFLGTSTYSNYLGTSHIRGRAA